MSQRRRPITLPELGFLSFDPTAQAADKKKGATGEAARPVGEAMLDTITARSGARLLPGGGRGDGIDRAHAHAEEWLKQQTARGEREVFSAEFTITPQMALLLLKRNPDNRNLSKKRIAEIRADLERGRYVLNGEPIIVAKEGLLNDGQHRLIACVESGVTFRSLVVFGVSRSSRLTLDQGNARTVADYLDMQGAEGETKVLAATARMLWQFSKFGKLREGGGFKQKNAWPTKAEILIAASEHEREISRAVQAVKTGSRLVGSRSFATFCYIVLSRADTVMGPIFVERILDGANLKVGSPAYLLRERFIAEPGMKSNQRFELVVRAWNATRKGKEISHLRIAGSVPKIEA